MQSTFRRTTYDSGKNDFYVQYRGINSKHILTEPTAKILLLT